MKVELTEHTCVVTKELGDPRFTRSGYSGAGAESAFLYHVKRVLIAHGHDLIKKEMAKDKAFQHMMSEGQYYLRTRNPKSPKPHIFIYNTAWMVRDAGEEFNREGTYTFQVVRDVFGILISRYLKS